MSFVSPEFALLALLFFPLYWALAERPRWQRGLLVVSGYGLYASWSWVFALALAGYSLTIWALGRWITQAPLNRPTPRLRVALGLVGCVLFLVLAKYYEFLRQGAADVLQLLGWVLPLPVMDVVAPVGVSFFTFQAITYLVRCAQPQAQARPLAEVVLFLCFWPTLFAGPIVRADDFFAQLDSGQPGRALAPWRALYLILLGASQKLVLASWLAQSLVDPVFTYPEGHSGLAVLAAVLAYSLQILLDFGGYTLIVTGLGLLLGYQLPLNFRQPYLARNLQEFWQRWHVSLSSFIRDYIYIPLGGNRRGWGRTQLNLLFGMLVSGAWHGANWTFIVWGLLHGLGVVAFNLGRRLGVKPLPGWLAQGLTLAFVGLAWLFFRADTLEQALRLLQRLGAGWEGWLALGALPAGWLLLWAVVVQGLSRHASTLELWAVQRLQGLRHWQAAALLAVWLWAVVALGPEGVPGFIYYRF